jgi:hypothetical protein
MSIKTPLLSENPIFNSLSQNLTESYEQFLGELREDISDEEVSPYLSEDFQEELSFLIRDENLNQYSPLKFYWLNLIDKIVDTLALIEEEIDDSQELIGAFSESDLLGFVIELLEKNNDAAEVLQNVLEIQELQIISFFKLHIAQDTWQPSGPVSYSLTPEIGESNGLLVLGENQTIYNLQEFTNDSIVPIVGYFPKDASIQILVGDDVKTIEAESPSPKKVVQSFSVLPGAPKAQGLVTDHFDKCLRAVDLISKLSPNLAKILQDFTHTITPIYEEEIVSYSMAILPGFSCINMNNRDFVDMIDDLLHENGHHFLNAALEGEEELIYEDDDKIFYSPWRRSLRPIRGLYHGAVTFYWAYRLFKELSLWGELEDNFSKAEIEKIYMRFLEESIMIQRCEEELKKAHELEKVTDFGLKITNTILDEIKNDRDLEEGIKAKLSPQSIHKLEELEKSMRLTPEA